MTFFTKSRSEQLLEARLIALRLHGEQKYGDHPYEVHLDHVVQVLRRFEIDDPDLLAAGYLHDVIEDTSATKEVLGALTTPRIAELVDAISDGPGKNRKERKQRPYELIPTVRDAIMLKLADRIANLESGHARESSLVAMYSKEQLEFEEKLLDFKPTKNPRLARMWNYCRLLTSR